MRICRNGLCLFVTTLPVNSPGNVRYSQHLMCFFSVEGSCEGEELLPFVSDKQTHSSCKQDQVLALLENISGELPGWNAPLTPSSLPRFCLYLLLSPHPKQEWLSLSTGKSGFALFCYLSQVISWRYYCLPPLFGLKDDTKHDFSSVYGIFWGICTFHL